MHSDTAREAARIQDQAYRAMSGARRAEIALGMSVAVRELAIARIRRAHPEWTHAQVIRELVYELYGIRIQP